MITTIDRFPSRWELFEITPTRDYFEIPIPYDQHRYYTDRFSFTFFLTLVQIFLPVPVKSVPGFFKSFVIDIIFFKDIYARFETILETNERKAIEDFLVHMPLHWQNALVWRHTAGEGEQTFDSPRIWHLFGILLVDQRNERSVKVRERTHSFCREVDSSACPTSLD